jgi:hypothetical protein
MKMRALSIFFFLFSCLNVSDAQMFIRTSDLFPVNRSDSRGGELVIIQDQSADTLMSRYILGKKLLRGGMEGYRIQIYRSSNRNAREESNKIRAEFMMEYPDISSYAEYAEPGYFLVRAGDFRSRMEGTKWLYLVRKKYPNAYMVPCIINFPGLKKQ